MKTCSIEECNGKFYARGWCWRHYQKWFSYGDPLKGRLKTKEELGRIGKGHLTTHGYRAMSKNGKQVYEHTIKAEKVLGKKLPDGAVIHHIDGNGTNNCSNNFVICNSNSYHLFLHARKRAYDFCGNANWKKCGFCKKYDDPINMKKLSNRSVAYHRECHNKYQSDRNFKKEV